MRRNHSTAEQDIHTDAPGYENIPVGQLVMCRGDVQRCSVEVNDQKKSRKEKIRRNQEEGGGGG